MSSARGLIFHPEKDHILIVRRAEWDSNPGKWELPGGGIEEDEDPRETVIREIREETGLEAELEAKHGEAEVDIGYKITTSHVFELRIENDEVSLSEEHSEFEWIEKNSLKDKDTVPGFHKYLGLTDLKIN